jgi:hypothetical protein
MIDKETTDVYEKILALVSLAAFASFMGILGLWVDAIDLKVVLLVTVAMAAYDFARDVFASKKRS